MNYPNDFLARLTEAADANGFTIIEYEARSPGYVMIRDLLGTEITIRSEYGMRTLPYIQRIRAITREDELAKAKGSNTTPPDPFLTEFVR